MQALLNDRQTICALATSVGGALGVIRVSGNDAIDIVDRAFKAPKSKKLHALPPQTVQYGHIVDEGEQTIKTNALFASDERSHGCVFLQSTTGANPH